MREWRAMQMFQISTNFSSVIFCIMKLHILYDKDAWINRAEQWHVQSYKKSHKISELDNHFEYLTFHSSNSNFLSKKLVQKQQFLVLVIVSFWTLHFIFYETMNLCWFNTAEKKILNNHLSWSFIDTVFILLQSNKLIAFICQCLNVWENNKSAINGMWITTLIQHLLFD